jgi:exodeoxyribonuclease-3
MKSAIGPTDILRPARGWERPSDHVPIVAEFDI